MYIILALVAFEKAIQEGWHKMLGHKKIYILLSFELHLAPENKIFIIRHAQMAKLGEFV